MDLDALENKFVINSQLRKSIFCLKLDNACAHHFTFDIHSLHHNDRYISVVPPKEKVWGGPQSLLSVTPPINSSSTRVFYEAYEVHFEQTLSFIEIIFSYSTCGAKWCQRHVWVWQTIFWRSEKLQKKDGQYHWDELNYHQHCNNKTNTQMYIWMTVLWWNNNERNCITVKINWLVGIKYFQMHLVELFPLNQTWGGIPATSWWERLQIIKFAI